MNTTTRENVDTKQWGPPAWQFLSGIIQSYPIEATQYDQLWMIDFLIALGDALPCEKCRINYKQYLHENPIYNHVLGRETILNWLNIYKTKYGRTA